MELNSEARLALLYQAEHAGDVYLVDEDAKPLLIKNALSQRCWAHLRSAEDGEFYVQELPGSRELTEPRYLAILGLV